jgi:S-adenosyl-L-methionine hydrolase (adenosine-forming)
VTATRIFLASDFGLDDEFVGVLHAVLARLAPEARVVDLSHGIAPFDVAGGAALLERAVPHLGDGVLLAVVDPGVGTDRRGVAIEVEGDGPRHLVGPDNGLLLGASRLLGGATRAVAVARSRFAVRGDPRTFDGRDVFAPCAARLATGATLESVGDEVDVTSLVALPEPHVVRRTLDDGLVAVTAVVRWIDRFGNVQLGLDGDVLDGLSSAALVARDHDAIVPIVGAFAELARGTVGVLRDANGAVALVVAEGSAASRLHVAVGDHIELIASFGPPR